jgi:hypothetical protein
MRIVRMTPTVAIAVVLLAAARPASAGECKPVLGHFTSSPVSIGCTSPVGFCTAGRLIGGIQGSYAFTMLTAAPADSPNPAGITFYTGRSEVSLDHGGTVVLADTGAIDLNPFGVGRMAALLSVTGGTTSGFLQLRGSIDFVTGGVTGDYFGEICGP